MRRNKNLSEHFFGEEGIGGTKKSIWSSDYFHPFTDQPVSDGGGH